MRRISTLFVCTLVLLSFTINRTTSSPAPAVYGPVFESRITTALFQLFVNLFKYLHYSLEQSSKLFQAVLHDETIVQSNITERNRAIFMNYVEAAIERNKPLPTNISALDGFMYILQQIHTINEFEDIVGSYNTSFLETPSNEDKLIEATLKRNGLETLIFDLKSRKAKFLGEFLAKMEFYKESLSDEERQKAKKLVEWYDKYSEETDEEKQNDVFTEFVQMFVKF